MSYTFPFFIRIVRLSLPALFAVSSLEAQTNVALNKTSDGDVAFNNPTANGNDGNTANFAHADNTSAAPNNPYWRDNLQGVFNLTRIELVDRTGGEATAPRDGGPEV